MKFHLTPGTVGGAAVAVLTALVSFHVFSADQASGLTAVVGAIVALLVPKDQPNS